MSALHLPTLCAGLNALALALLVAGRVAIARGARALHQRLMLSAFAVSSLFLVLYLADKTARDFEHTRFHARGLGQALYLALLASHVVLAAAVPVLALLLIRFGLRGELARHRRLARVAWPLWVYVSLSGVLIYALLYHWNPPAL